MSTNEKHEAQHQRVNDAFARGGIRGALGVVLENIDELLTDTEKAAASGDMAAVNAALAEAREALTDFQTNPPPFLQSGHKK